MPYWWQGNVEMTRCFLLLLMFSSALLACSQTGFVRSVQWEYQSGNHTREDIKDKFVLHKERSWNYYKRGVDFMKGGFWEDAIQDFQTSISLLSEDRRSARTYGLNRIDYFANRELGVAYFKTGKYNKAIDKLKASLRSAESARAKFYLVKAFRNIDQENIAPPEIEIVSPKDGEVVTQKIIRLKVSLKDPSSLINSVWVDGDEIFIELGKADLTFEKNIKLKRGTNKVTIAATNLAGKKTIKEIVIKLANDSDEGQLPMSSREAFELELGIKDPQRQILLAANLSGRGLRELCVLTLPMKDRAGSTLDDLSTERANDPPVDIDQLVEREDRYRLLMLDFAYKVQKSTLYSQKTLDEVIFGEIKRYLGKETDRFVYICSELETIRDKLGETKYSNQNLDDIDVAIELKEMIHPMEEVDGILIVTVYYDKLHDSGLGLLLDGMIYDIELKKPVLDLYPDVYDEFKYDEFKYDKGTAKYEEKIQEMANKFAKKIVLSFKVADGKVLSVVDGERVFTSLNTNKGALRHMKLFIYRQEQYGKPYKLDIEGRIDTEPDDKGSMAKITKMGKDEIKEGDIVITK
jgi:tetratricopeptide (TPR) repeat protein